MKPYVISLLAFLIFTSIASVFASNNDDLNTLLKLKSGLLGPGGSGLDDWENGTLSHCQFSGITCDENQNIIALHISSLTLKGSLLPEIGNLDKLVNLSITCTALSGHLPQQLAGLPALRYLNISNNNFSGPFPDITGGFQELRILDAYNNMLSGDLPSCLADVPELMYIHLGGNYFSGEIPESYAGIEKLEYLGLNGNSLSGRIPAKLGRLSRLEQLYLGYFNVYEGGIPEELGNLSNLVRLDFGSCNLSGPIPGSLGRLSHLDSLFLQMNNLSGTIPPELGRLRELKSLDLSVNELTGEVPESFAELKSVELINLFSNHLCGSIPQFIAELPNLEVLQLWGNNFTMELPPMLGINGRLKKLDVATNRLTGQIPEGLCAGGKLEMLVLMENAFFGQIPEKLGECKSLARVRLARNFLNGTIPAKLFDLPVADMLELNDNLFSGELPPNVSARNISNLLLSNNLITGSIPASIGNLRTLQNLALESNQFSGEIPPQISQLTQLSKLNLSGNSLTGEIPVELSHCTSLVSFDLSRNSLTGRIPEELTTLPILNTLNLSRNQFSGEIPNEIQRMRSLTVLDLSYNNLEGTIPAQGQFVVFNTTAFVGNPGLCSGGTRLDASGSCTRGHDFAWGSGEDNSDPRIGGVSTSKYLIIGLVIALAVMVGIGGTRAWFAWKSNKRRRSKAWKMTAFQRLSFTVEDVMECLKDDNVIGKGGAGIVYRGSMNNGTEVAIKRLVGRGSGCGNDRGFTAEVTTLGQIRHRNIVRLLGFVSNRETNLLLYKYMPNGSLGEMLHGSKGAHLGWEARWRIATEAARGLCYLHHDCSPPILHRDVKSNNILLDSAFEAHVADFGLAKFLQDSGVSECVSSIAGSYGYIAPEYAYTLRVDEKSDVYSFGVVLLELVTGRRPVGGFGEGVDIVQWVRKTTGEVAEPSDIATVLSIVDSRLTASPLNLIINLYKVAMLCVEEKSDARPAMREVVHLLSNGKAIPDLLAF